MMMMINETTPSILIDFDETAVNFRRRISARLKVGNTDLLGWEDKAGAYHCFDRVWIHDFVLGGLRSLLYCRRHGESSM